MDLNELDAQARRSLIMLACHAAWSDLAVVQQERDVIMTLASRLELDEAAVADVNRWLKGPPPEIDPYDLPREHKEILCSTLRDVVEADGVLAPEECETLRLVREFMQ